MSGFYAFVAGLGAAFAIYFVMEGEPVGAGLCSGPALYNSLLSINAAIREARS